MLYTLVSFHYKMWRCQVNGGEELLRERKRWQPIREAKNIMTSSQLKPAVAAFALREMKSIHTGDKPESLRLRRST